MEVKVSMSYLDDEKYSVKNISGNELVVDMYEKGKKENLSPMELLLSAVTTCAAVEVVSMIKKRRRDFKDIKAESHFMTRVWSAIKPIDSQNMET